MTDTGQAQYTFKIDDYTPETMPFGRLVEYYSELTKLIGLPEHLRLVDVFKSSHGTRLSVNRHYQHRIDERLVQIRAGNAPKGALRARDQINYMLREDGTSGEFSGPAGSNVIAFPGKKADDEVLYSVCDQAVFSGELYHIAGTRDQIKVRVATDAFGVVYCRATREMGIALRDFLFEKVTITGRGIWKRTTDGAWAVNDVLITDYAPLVAGNLRQTVDALRGLDVDWPDDALSETDQPEDRGFQVH